MALPNSQLIYGEAVRALAVSADELLQSSVNRTVAILPGQPSLISFLFFVLVLLAGWFTTRLRNRSSKGRKNYPPGVPGGLPLIGNLLQLKSQKPHRTITDLSEQFGPIFQLNLGPLKYVVLTSPELAKEAGVTKFESVSKRNLLNNLKVWSKNKNIVALSDYGDEYRKLKKLLSSRVLGTSPQKLLACIREQLLKTVLDDVRWKLDGSSGAVNVRESIKHYIFPFVMHQILGYVPESVYVPEIGKLELWDIFLHLVVNPMKSVITVDWRDFLPFFNWLPNPVFKKKVLDVEKVRCVVVRALVEQKRRHLELQGPTGGFLEHLLTVETNLSSAKVELLTWEPIIEGSDTSLVTAEWAMYELAKHQDIQERLHQEIQKVVGSRMVTESDLPNLSLLDAIFKETLRLHCPIVLLPPREVEEDITIGGYHIPKGWQVLINVYGINNDKKRWAKWNEWIPDRFLNAPELDMGVNDFQLIPFGLGKRRCAGALQATTIVCSFIASFVQRFHCSLPRDDASFLEDTAYLTTQKLHPLEVIARPRSSHVQH
ncbi:unnamed protein product [Calypogeia fissa]